MCLAVCLHPIWTYCYHHKQQQVSVNFVRQLLCSNHGKLRVLVLENWQDCYNSATCHFSASFDASWATKLLFIVIIITSCKLKSVLFVYYCTRYFLLFCHKRMYFASVEKCLFIYLEATFCRTHCVGWTRQALGAFRIYKWIHLLYKHKHKIYMLVIIQ